MSDYSTMLRELAKEAKALQADTEVVTDEKKPVKVNNTFTLTLANYPDIIITKNMPRATKHLIIMPSQGIMFIKTETKNGDSSSDVVLEDSYASFTSGMPDITLPEGFWAKKIEKGRPFGRRLMEIFGNDTLIDIIKKGILPKNIDLCRDDTLCKYPSLPEKEIVEAYRLNPSLFLENKDDRDSKAYELLVSEPVFVRDITELFGIENARDFLREYNQSLVSFKEEMGYRYSYRNRSYNSLVEDNHFDAWENNRVVIPDVDGYRNNACRSVIPHIHMKYSTFKEYVLYDACRFGFPLNMREFFRNWNDSLNLEYLVYGKIVEKYPKSLPTYHNQISYKAGIMKKEIDEKKFNMQVEKSLMYEGKYKDYVFIAPKCRQDFYDEAGQQSNCLAGYVNRFTDGRCIIIFMRHKESPDISFITVEIVDGKVTQAKLASNREPLYEDSQILLRWVEKCNNNDKEDSETKIA